MRRLAVYHPAGRAEGTGANVFGMQVANLELFQALARHGGLDRLDVLTHVDVDDGALRSGLLAGRPSDIDIRSALVTNQSRAAEAGAVIRGGPRIDELAWIRRASVGSRAYSLVGLIHTIAPPAMRQDIAGAAVAPTEDWDAVICTSPSIQSAMERMFEEWADYLGARFNGRARPRPRLPLLPLGVNGEVFETAADRPDVRRRRRDALGAADDDIVLLWVGRLSYFEKAFPQVMFRAAQEAAEATGKTVHFAMVGWFPGGDQDRDRYRQASDAYAPDVRVHFLDGNDRVVINDMWAASDVFVSLIDNIQETFGITPLEAMAAGLPVVVSDWDGYRYTVRDGIEGMLIPTLGAPPQNLLHDQTIRHALAMMSYQSYVGSIAQHTAVHVGRAADAIAQLIRSPQLRRKMGNAGRQRIRDTFDWKVVAPQYVALTEELTAIRTAASDDGRRMPHPLKGDPYRDFAGFPTRVLGLEDAIWIRAGGGAADLDRSAGVQLDQFAAARRASRAEMEVILASLSDGRTLVVRAILEAFPIPRRRAILLGLMWMAKAGILDWRTHRGQPANRTAD